MKNKQLIIYLEEIMTVSFTKDEMEWLFSFIDIATQDLNEEENEFDKSANDASNKIKEKLRIAQIKR